MSDEDKAWLREIFKRHFLGVKLDVPAVFTDEEDARYSEMLKQHRIEYIELWQEVKDERI
jgi:hypothetical protein